MTTTTACPDQILARSPVSHSLAQDVHVQIDPPGPTLHKKLTVIADLAQSRVVYQVRHMGEHVLTTGSLTEACNRYNAIDLRAKQ